jgi:hypothetical protein
MTKEKPADEKPQPEAKPAAAEAEPKKKPYGGMRGGYE